MKLSTPRRTPKRSYRRRYASSLWMSLALMLALLSGRNGRIGAQAPDPCAPPLGNAIVCENQLPGAPSTEWDVAGAGDPTIQGFATDISVNRGQSIQFKIATDATNYRLDIYRMGYYGGFGARKVATVDPSVALPQSQPACLNDLATGLIDCGNWATSAVWAVPATAVSGIYFARVVRPDTGGASHIVFVVRHDGRHSDLLFQTSDTTWQAYNRYGGNSLYEGAPVGRAYKVSYNRPLTVRADVVEDSPFNAEYPMVRWLEANGFDVSYATGVDTDRMASELLIHKAFLSVGHDEYWSGTQRSNVEAARAAGVHLAFFSGNEVFWKTRWEPSISVDATEHRTLVAYKETHANAKIDPSPQWTGTWRDPRFSPPADGGRPENALTGTIFTVNAGTSGIRVPAAAGKHRFWRGTDAATLAPGASLVLPDGTLGYEWDEDLDNGFRPAGLVRLSDTTVSGVSYLQDYGSTYDTGTANHALTLYRHASGALVFGAGTVQWSWGLDSNHDRGAEPPSTVMQQATVNLFADMAVQPLTLQPGLTTATASADVLAPTSSVVSPAHESSVTAGTVVTISGVAVDNGGGLVSGVEVSVDGGTTWRRATGGSAWTFSWSTGSPRVVTILTRAVDDSGNLEQPSTGTEVHVQPSPCPCSLWSSAQGPAGPVQVDPARVELGTRFYSDSSGYVTAIRFFKPAQNTGTHIGSLWTTTGTRLSMVTFSAESASGWQQATLPDPIAITANTAYVVSYNTASGFYAGDNGYFNTSGVDANPLYAPPTASGPNGVFSYGPGQFPSQTFQGANYWVDVVFVRSLPADSTPPSVTVVSPANGQSGVGPTAQVTATFNENVQNVSTTTFELTQGGTPVAATVSYAAIGRTATLTPSAPLAYDTTYTARVRGGVSGVADMAGNRLAADYVWTFATSSPPPPPPDEGPGGPILIVSSSARPFSRYYAEILRAEGLNDFLLTDIATLTPSKLAAADVVLLGHVALSSAEASMLANWVAGGGKLVAMRPDKQLASLLGLSDAGTTLAEGYLRIDTSRSPGAGIASETMQFHGSADRYTLNGAIAVATLFSDAATATTSPAVTLRPVGSNGGQAASFTYDLAQSIVYMRQGNPAWAGQERDGNTPIRSNDLFFGTGVPDWVDFNRIAIPQADEQQRLLANMILLLEATRPLPRFWYFPRGEKAAIVMTGDDHGNNGTAGRFDIYKGNSPANCSVNDWECVRATSYIYPTTPITNAEVAGYTADGFEIAVHVTTGCQDYTPASLEQAFATDLALFSGLFPSVTTVATNRTHCVPWSDYDTQAQVSLAHGIRLDTNYYYFPAQWIQNRPGFMTGSGMPMRFTKSDGTLIDVFQAATQMSDEAGQTWPFTVDALLDRAIGPEGYYGFFVANMHTDTAAHVGSEAIVASALARSVPVISASQLLTWVDGRNAAAHAGLTWSPGAVHFTVTADARANGLQTLLPAVASSRLVTSITRNGQPVAFSVQRIKGIDYAVFDSPAGAYEAIYSLDQTGVSISDVAVQPDINGATITWSTNEGAYGRVDYGTSPNALTSTAIAGTLSTSHSLQLSGLAPETTYFFRVTAADLVGNTTVAPELALPPNSFATLPAVCPCTIWTPAQAPGQPFADDTAAIEVGVKFKPLVAGWATAVRFYKGPLNTGTHIGNLWTANGTKLATVTFANETATGWQEATLSQPVPLTANTTYVVSYHTNSGGYAADAAYFLTSGVTRGPLQALAEGVSGANGLFEYGASAFPTQSFQSSNYWVDLVFEPAPPPPPPWAQSVTDTTAAHFDAGTVGAGTFVARIADGEVILAPTVQDFTGTDVPAGWVSTPWNAGGVTTVAAGHASVDGALLGIQAEGLPGQSLEFVATFSTDPNQHGGYALAFQDSRWAIFSTGAGGGLQARTNNGVTPIDTAISGSWLNAPHRYRIDWAASSITFSIDGVVVATHSQAITGLMRPVFSDFAVGGQNLTVDVVQTGPYAQAGTFRSRILDGGSSSRWRSVVSTTQVPAGTAMSLSARFGETPVPGPAWSPFVPLALGSTPLNVTSRYVQYQVTLTGAADTTPVLQTITFGGLLSTVSGQILSAIDPPPASVRAASFTIHGWAVDTRATSGTGIGAIDMFATPSGGSPIFLGAASLGGNRPDVALALGNPAYAPSGFSFTVSLPPGQYTISATPRSSVDAAFGQPATAQVAAFAGSFGRIQSPAAGRLATTTLTVRGYAGDVDAVSGTGVDAVEVFAYPTNGALPFLVGHATYGQARPELTGMFDAQFLNSGFSLSATLAPGTYAIEAQAHSVLTGWFALPDPVTITVPTSATELHVELATGPALYQGFTIGGWAIDPAALSGSGVDVVDVWGFPHAGGPAVYLGGATSLAPRPDIAETRGQQFTMSGFSVKTTANLAPGTYQVVTLARSTVSGQFDAVDSRALTILAATGPVIQINDLADGARVRGLVTVNGFAFDPRATTGLGVDAIHMWVYPDWGSGKAPVFAGLATYGDESDPELGARFGGQFARSGGNATIELAGGPGPYLIAFFAHSTVDGTFAVATRLVTVPAPQFAFSIDSPQPGSSVASSFRISGWAIDRADVDQTPDESGVEFIQIYAFPLSGGAPTLVCGPDAKLPRPDVAAIFGPRFLRSGFDCSPNLAPGAYNLAVLLFSDRTRQYSPASVIPFTVR